MSGASFAEQIALDEQAADSSIERALLYPRLRIMGSKHRLLPWIAAVLSDLEFSTAFDGFSGSGAVGYLMKCMGKRVTSNDFLRFAHHFAAALVANSSVALSEDELDGLLRRHRGAPRFIERTFHGIFYSDSDNRFLDTVWSNLDSVGTGYRRSLVLAALFQACLRKQPRGVFTVSGTGGKYDDGRRGPFSNSKHLASCGQIWDIKRRPQSSHWRRAGHYDERDAITIRLSGKLNGESRSVREPF